MKIPSLYYSLFLPKLRFALPLLALLIGAGATQGQEHAAIAPFSFKGRLLVAVSDADMVASAYVNGRLGPKQGGDTLTVIPLNGQPNTMRLAQIPMSNSVTGPPAVVALAANGRYALVVETLGARPAGKVALKLGDLPLGKTITVVDLLRPAQPRVVQRMTCPAQPESISVNALGTLVAVSFGLKGAGRSTPLALYRFRAGRLSTATLPRIPGWVMGHGLTDAEFSPQGNTLALLDSTAPSISFVQVSNEGNGNLKLSGWGNTVRIGKGPFLVRFTPDGRHVLVNTSDPDADTASTPYDAQRGTVLSIRLAAAHAANGTPIHGIVSRAMTGVIPEGLAVSPNGRWVATTNLEHSYMPFNDPRQSFYASLTLLHLNPQTGVLQRVGDFPFDSILSETVLFDNDSRALAVTTFDHFDGRQPSGSIDFWRIATEPLDPQRVELVKANFSIPLQRGAHTMVIAR